MEEIKKSDAMAPPTSRRIKETYDASLHEQEKESSPCKKPYRGMPPPSDNHTISGKSSSMLTSKSIQKQQESPSSPDNPTENSNIVGNTGNQNESINTVIKLMNDDINMSIAQWTNSFMESEQYEAYSLKQLDQLILQADAVEKELLRQKEVLCKRLADLSNALKV